MCGLCATGWVCRKKEEHERVEACIPVHAAAVQSSLVLGEDHVLDVARELLHEFGSHVALRVSDCFVALLSCVCVCPCEELELERKTERSVHEPSATFLPTGTVLKVSFLWTVQMKG